MKQIRAILLSYIWFFTNLVLAGGLFNFVFSYNPIILTQKFPYALLFIWGVAFALTSLVTITFFAKSILNYPSIYQALKEVD